MSVRLLQRLAHACAVMLNAINRPRVSASHGPSRPSSHIGSRQRIDTLVLARIRDVYFLLRVRAILEAKQSAWLWSPSGKVRVCDTKG